MNCEICQSRAASSIVLRRRQGEEHRTYVCGECAGERARLYADGSLDFERIMQSMGVKSASGENSTYTCRLCGTTLAEIFLDGSPGCCLCYTRFAGELEAAVRESQACTHHVGKTKA